MPITRINQSTPRNPGNPGLVVWAEVDIKESETLIERVWSSLSGPSLEAYLAEQVHPHFENEIVQRFAYEGDAASGPWAALSEATQNIREQQGFGPDWPINIRTEDMFQTVTHEADYMAGMNSAEMMLPGHAATGVVAEKIRTAQEGRSSNPMGNFGPTPPRPVLATSERDLAFILMTLQRWIIWHVSGGFGGLV